MVRIFINSSLPGLYEVITPYCTKRFDNFEQLMDFVADECGQERLLHVNEDGEVTTGHSLQRTVDKLGEIIDRTAHTNSIRNAVERNL